MNRASSFASATFWRGIFFLFAGLLAANAQFPTKLNISLVGSNKPPQASTGYGDVWGEGNIGCLGVWQSTAYNNLAVGIYDISNPGNPTLSSIYNPFPGSSAHRHPPACPH